jgi:assimilatory nitrate reductase catalytic subunit
MPPRKVTAQNGIIFANNPDNIFYCHRFIMSASPVHTTCPYCGVGCGVTVSQTADSLAIDGDKTHPANFGRLCSKGAALAETLDLEGRLLYPEINAQTTSWDEALDLVAARFQATMNQYGADAVAFYVSGQLLTEDYYVANKLMKGFIGSGNIDTNSRLCMSSAVAAHKRAFGEDAVPCSYEDVEMADCVVLVGSNTAWCHPVLYQRLKAAKQQRPELKIIVVDPRRTATCDIADLHLPLQAGSDAILFNGLLNYLRREDVLDLGFIEDHTEYFTAAMRTAQESARSIPQVAFLCGLPETSVAEFFRTFAQTEKTVTLFSQGINQSSAGTDKANSIINCHLATGRIGKVGMGAFSITGQPNAMGGREVGGLANMLAAHTDFTPQNTAMVQRFWQSPVIAEQAGLKAVALFEAIKQGKVKALWVMATNPAVSLPDANLVRKAMAQCEFVVVSDCVRNTDTTRYADVLLPAATWGEKDGTVTNSERRISRQRAFLPLPAQVKPDWWIISQVAQRLGFKEAFNYQTVADIFREHAALSGFENNGQRLFNISELATLNNDEYQQLEPIQWPIVNGQGTARLFTDNRYSTASGKAQFVAITPRLPVNLPDADYPLVLNTGRLRDQWHTMTRTGKTARLMEHAPEPFVTIHPHEAQSLNLIAGCLVKISSRWGTAIVRLHCSEEQSRGTAFMPMHWNDQFASHAVVGCLVNPAVDPISGQPELKHTPVRIQAYTPAWHGFVLSRAPLQLQQQDYWVMARGRQFLRYELASETEPSDWHEWAKTLCAGEGEWLEFSDKATGRHRLALIKDQNLQAVLFVARSFDLPTRTWLSQLFSKESLDDTDRMSLLAGKTAIGMEDVGETVCACFGVGVNTLRKAIAEQGLVSVEAIGAVLKAGTNCGSCVPELRKLIQDVKKV